MSELAAIETIHTPMEGSLSVCGMGECVQKAVAFTCLARTL